MSKKRPIEEIDEASTVAVVAVPMSAKSQLSFVFSESFRAKLTPPMSFEGAFEKAKAILCSNLFRTAFVEEVPDANMERFDQLLTSQTFEVCTLKLKATVEAFAAVYREAHPTTIFFNPWMVLNILDKEHSIATDHPVRSQITLFLTVKLVHEVSHLLHHACTNVQQSATGRTPNKSVREDMHLKLNSPPVQTNVLYDDLGEMIERRIFGGMIEAKWHNPDSFMDIDNCALYKSKGDRVGFYVSCSETLSKINADSSDFAFVLGEPFQAKKTKAFAFISLRGGVHRLSQSDPDVDIEDELDEEEDEENDNLWVA